MSNITKSNDDLLLESQSTNTKLDTLNTNVSKESKQDTMITSLSTIATNTNGIGLGTTGAQTTVARSASSVTLVASNADRKEVMIRNDSAAKLYINFGATATVNKGFELKNGDVLLDDKYSGVISGIWASGGAGNAEIIEVD